MNASCRVFFSLLVFLFGTIFPGKVSSSPLSPFSGTFRGFQDHHLILETWQGSRQIPFGKDWAIIISSQFLYPQSWLFPGDGISVFTDRKKIEIFPSWYFGKIAFVSPNRITLQDGFQFFLSSTPIFLNEKEDSSSALEAGKTVLVRFDSLNKRAADVWAFDFSSPRPLSIFWTHSAFKKFGGRLFLHVIAEGKPGGTISTQLLGVTKEFRMLEKFSRKEKAVYAVNVPIPQGVALPGSYLLFTRHSRPLSSPQSNGEDSSSETFLSPTPVALYTIPPKIKEIEPAAFSVSPDNPPLIFVRFDSGQAPLDPKSIRFFLDGKNLSESCYRTPYLVFYYPSSLSPGRHRAFFSAKVVGGLRSLSMSWQFQAAKER